MGLNNISLFNNEIENKPVEEPDAPPEQTQPSGTNFNEIYKLFLISLQDYELKRLFNDSPEAADDLLMYFLLRAIPLFINCQKDIEQYHQNESGENEFNDTLTLTEKTILSDLMVQCWLDFIISDTTQLGGLQDTDFKRESASNNLKEKANYADRWREKVNQKIINYGLKNTPFAEWAVGNYGL